MVFMLLQQRQFAIRLLSAFSKQEQQSIYYSFHYQQRRMASILVQNRSKYGFLAELGLVDENQGVFDGQEWKGSGPIVDSLSPATNEVIARVKTGTPKDYERVASATKKAFRDWAALPAPNRGEIVRQIGDQLRKNLDNLGALVSYYGIISTFDLRFLLKWERYFRKELEKFKNMSIYVTMLLVYLACSLEKLFHRNVRSTYYSNNGVNLYFLSLISYLDPLGVVGVISAFNFPCAVYGWNNALALACGDTVLWKPAPSTPLTAIAIIKLIEGVLRRNSLDPAICTLICGEREVGNALTADPRVDLVSFTGSTEVGRAVGIQVQSRFGKVYFLL